ncbi:hypothetical protein [Terriglobus albidus]|uniref:hypothetical protein n=1 Tax=Terriglobus albidus TaxID=1592106 RepID=UPI0021E0169F|nr:hypothetical protein [Terriglobus albidus]
MRTLLIAVLIVISAVLGGCLIALSTLVRSGAQFFHSNNAVAVDANVSVIPVMVGAIFGAAGGYLLARVFLPRG